MDIISILLIALFVVFVSKFIIRTTVMYSNACSRKVRASYQAALQDAIRIAENIEHGFIIKKRLIKELEEANELYEKNKIFCDESTKSLRVITIKLINKTLECYSILTDIT